MKKLYKLLSSWSHGLLLAVTHCNAIIVTENHMHFELYADVNWTDAFCMDTQNCFVFFVVFCIYAFW